MTEIIIRLMSDLCAANGESVGNGIDSDICTDNYGFPYIPGRRLLGCLRDAAMELQRFGLEEARQENIDRIFGNPSGQEGVLCVGNAVIPGIEIMHEYIASLKRGNKDFLIRQSTQEKVIRLFSSVRGQTRIGEDGKAQSGSLRFIRVLNQYNAITGKQLEFRCPVDISALSEEEKELLNNACKVLRHIGLNRNRGLGNITVKMEDSVQPCVGDKTTAVMTGYEQDTAESEKLICIPYQVAFESPITIQEYLESGYAIRSRTVIGVFANLYLGAGREADETFRHLFLDGTVKWSALTPVINGMISDPAPAMLMKLKNGGGRIINVYAGAADEWKSKKPKSLDGYFAAADEESGTYYVAQPESEINYHNRLTDLSGTDRAKRGLYMQDSLKQGMVYGGYVLLSANEDVQRAVKELLNAGRIRIGRSKKVQYGAAVVSEAKLKTCKSAKTETKEKEAVFAILKSDLVLQEGAMFVTNHESVRSRIAEAFGLKNIRPETFADYCRYSVLSGYNAMWQMQKPKVRAVKAGSVYAFEAEKGVYPSRKIIGEYQQEGLGIVEIVSYEQMKKIAGAEDGTIMHKVYTDSKEEGRQLEQFLLYEAALEELREYAFEFKKHHEDSIRKVPIGRLRQMLHDADNISKLWAMAEEMKTSDVSSDSRGKREETINLLSAFYGTDRNEIDWSKMIADKQLSKALISNPEALKKIKQQWKEPLSTLLHQAHYEKGGNKK